MDRILKILFLEDVKNDAELVWREIEKNGIAFHKLLVDNRPDFIDGLKSFKPDIIIADYALPQFDGIAALLLRNKLAPLRPFILVTGSINEEVAVYCMKLGADDYILKENLSRLGPAVINTLDKYELLRQKKTADEELQMSEMRLQKAQSIAHVGSWELNLSSKTVWCSDEALRIYGFDKKSNVITLEQVQKSPLPEFRTILDETLDRLIKYNEPYEAEFKIRCANNGTIKSIHSKAELMTASASKQVKVIGVIQDITERKLSEESLHVSQQILEGILNAIPVRVFWKNRNLVYLGCNTVFARDAGYNDPKDIIGKDDFRMGWSDQAELYRSDDLQVIESGCSKFLMEESQTTPEGNTITLLTSKLPLLGSRGEISGVLGTYIDISERKRAEEELIMAKEKAEESDRLKTAFLHNISHEIRTPMNAIVGFTELLGEPDLDAKSRQSYIEVIMQSSNHLLAIITDIVDISNLEANLIKIVKNEININTTLKKLSDQFIPVVNEKRLALTFETGLNYPDAFILTDSTKLIQVISNLINNAIKFTSKGNIKFGYIVKNDFLEFFISDTGIGIQQEHHTRIFDRFYQVQNTVSRLYEGTGLGLTISKAYVELLGGKIWLSSEPGKGTSFFFTIPYEKQKVESMTVNTNIIQEQFDFPLKKTILVAEDIESNFKLIKYFLSGTNFDIIRAINGKEAVEKALSEKNVDLILMDVKMPVMDGYTAVKLIRESNSAIPIIVQTAYSDDKDWAIECGCSGFISKPFDKQSLLKAVSKFI
jgi:PAS domain S-box-containing protein